MLILEQLIKANELNSLRLDVERAVVSSSFSCRPTYALTSLAG
jgi:hypothetical protein